MKHLIRAGHVWAGDVSDNSVLIENGLIQNVGYFDDLYTQNTVVHEYPKALVVPGFTDAHLHMRWLGETLSLCDLRGCKSSREFLARIERFAKTLCLYDFLLGFGWDDREWEDKPQISHELIDAACLGHRAALTRVDGHSFLVSKALLEFSGVTKDTPNPGGGRIEKDQYGQPSGVFFDTAYELARRHIPKPDAEKIELFITKAIQHLLSFGVTSCRTFGSLDDFVAAAHMERKELLKMRVCACVPLEAMAWAIDLSAKTGTGNDMFWTGQVKLFADGSLGSKTALVSEPYQDGTKGLEVMSKADMTNIVRQAHQVGLGVAIHAIGDEAVKNALEAVSVSKGCDTIEHFQCAKPQQVTQAAKLGIPVIVNPAHIPLDIMAIKKEWSRLELFSYPIASLMRGGAVVGFGSDTPVVGANPLSAVIYATTRSKDGGGTLNIKEAISFSSSMRIATEASAAIIGGPARGRIEKGLPADIAVLSQDFRGKEPSEAFCTKVLATYVAGERVWNA